MSAGPAESSVATPVKGASSRPTASPPSRATISRRVSWTGGQGTSRVELWSVPMASLVRERLDDLLGDVDARAGEDRLLDDEVELLLLGDLVDHPGGALLDRGELLVAAQVEVLADLALHALEVAADVGELPLLLAPLRLGEGDVLALQLRLQVAPLLLDLGEVLVARGELALELLLGALGGCGLAEHPLGVHEADLELRRPCLHRDAGQCQQDCNECPHAGRSEDLAELELEPLDFVAGAVLDGLRHGEAQRAHRGIPAHGEAHRGAHVAPLDPVVRAPDVAR